MIIDSSGMCALSDLGTNDCKFSLNFGENRIGILVYCRFSLFSTEFDR